VFSQSAYELKWYFLAYLGVVGVGVCFLVGLGVVGRFLLVNMLVILLPIVLTVKKLKC